VIGEARRYLEALEAERDRQRSAGNGRDPGAAQSELPLFAASAPGPAPGDDAIRAALRALDPDGLSPKAALEALYRLRQLLDQGGSGSAAARGSDEPLTLTSRPPPT
jgi:DNA mismatch repair protein MutS